MDNNVTDRPRSSPSVDEAVLLCGGRGTRLGGETEKPLVEVGDRAMVARVIDRLAESCVRRVIAVTSPHTPATTAALEGRLCDAFDVSCEVVVGSGDGYVEDLNRGLDAAGGAVLSVTADLPLLRSRDVDVAIDAAIGSGASDEAIDGGSSDDIDSVSICVPASLKRDLGATIDTSFTHNGRELVPSGLNVVGDGTDRVIVRERESLAVNVNRPTDLELARRSVGRE